MIVLHDLDTGNAFSISLWIIKSVHKWDTGSNIQTGYLAYQTKETPEVVASLVNEKLSEFVCLLIPIGKRFGL